MATRISTGLANFFILAFRSRFDGGILEGRTGTQPASATNAPTGTLLWSMQLPADAFNPPVPGGDTMNKGGTWEDPAADASGICGWARFKRTTDSGSGSPGDHRFDISVGLAGSGADLILDNTNITIGQRVRIETFQVVQPPQP